MNTRSKNFEFREASMNDGAKMLEILEEPDFQGNISIIYTRRPNPVISFKAEGNDVIIMICQKADTKEMVGFGVCTIREHYIHGKLVNVGYLSGLRIKKAYRNIPFLLMDAYQELIERISNKGITWLYTTVLDDNAKVQQMFEKKRKSFPYYIPISNYKVFCVTTRLKKKSTALYEHKTATKEDIPRLLEFVNAKGSQQDLYPKITIEDLLGETRLNLHFSHYYISIDLEDGNIIATFYVWRQHTTKQHILYKYNGMYKFLKHVGPLLPYFGYPKLPKEGTELKYYYLSYFAYEEEKILVAEELIRYIASVIDSNYFLIGMVETDPLFQVMEKMAKITYGSKVYMVDYVKSEDSIRRIESLHTPYIECGLL
ncbi:MAG: GNAT family N-acetyltransferase [Vallitaleaceae bacterium]|nr:GNAT family N-acetyltransferase [Vallitaleaceae bacterium]